MKVIGTHPAAVSLRTNSDMLKDLAGTPAVALESCDSGRRRDCRLIVGDGWQLAFWWEIFYFAPRLRAKLFFFSSSKKAPLHLPFGAIGESTVVGLPDSGFTENPSHSATHVQDIAQPAGTSLRYCPCLGVLTSSLRIHPSRRQPTRSRLLRSPCLLSLDHLRRVSSRFLNMEGLYFNVNNGYVFSRIERKEVPADV